MSKLDKLMQQKAPATPAAPAAPAAIDPGAFIVELVTLRRDWETAAARSGKWTRKDGTVVTLDAGLDSRVWVPQVFPTPKVEGMPYLPGILEMYNRAIERGAIPNVPIAEAVAAAVAAGALASTRGAKGRIKLALKADAEKFAALNPRKSEGGARAKAADAVLDSIFGK